MSATSGGPELQQHLNELAELHALGALEPAERALVEAHVADCASCARALGEAEVTVAALGDAFDPALEPPERLGARIAASAKTVVPLGSRRIAPHRAAWPVRGLYAAAAALLLAVGVGSGALVERSSDLRQAARDSAVLATIATSHFNHVTLIARAPTAPVSKVLYARDGAWFYVVVDSTTCDCRVVARSAGGERDLGPPTVRGTTATLFARNAVRPSSVALTAPSGQVISEAPLVYGSR